MKKLSIGLATISALGLSGCLFDSASDIKGKWAIDLDQMTQKVQSMGASARDVQELKDTYIDGKLEVTDRALVFSITGEEGTTEAPYELLSSEGHCHKLKLWIEKTESVSQFCLRDGLLEIKSPGYRVPEIYRRDS